MLGQDLVALHQHQGTLDAVLQFANVALPVVTLQLRNRRGGEVGRTVPLRRDLRRILGQEVRGQRNDVLGPLAQRREIDGHDAQAIQQVLTELAVLDLPDQIAAGGRDESEIHRLGGRRAQGNHRFLLKHPQQLALEGRGHEGDLVEEHGATVGQRENAAPVPIGPGKGALAVAEQFGLEQGVGKRGGVDRQERPLAHGALVVNGTGDQLLAASALALNQHGRRRRCDLMHQFEHGLHPRVLRDDQRRILARRRLQLTGLLLNHGLLAVARDGLQHFVVVERLGDEVHGATSHRLDRQFDRSETGDQHDTRFGTAAAQSGQQLDARHSVHGDIGQHEVRRPVAADLERLLAALGIAHLGLHRLGE